MGNQPGRSKIENNIIGNNQQIEQSIFLYNNQPSLEIHLSTLT